MRGHAFLLFFSLIGVVNAQSVGSQNFFGLCDESSIEQNDLGAWAECGGNFLSPMVPNPLRIADSVIDSFNMDRENIGSKLNTVSIFNPIESLTTLVSIIFDVFALIFNSIFRLIMNAITFIIIFMVKFIFVYMFYISLGLQSVILYFDKGSQGLSSRDKITSTILLMAGATVFMLAYGGGWATW